MAGGIDSLESIPGSLNVLQFGLRLHRLAESIPGLLKSIKNTVSNLSMYRGFVSFSAMLLAVRAGTLFMLL
jgi:hypothetical protein